MNKAGTIGDIDVYVLAWSDRGKNDESKLSYVLVAGDYHSKSGVQKCVILSPENPGPFPRHDWGMLVVDPCCLDEFIGDPLKTISSKSVKPVCNGSLDDVSKYYLELTGKMIPGENEIEKIALKYLNESVKQ